MIAVHRERYATGCARSKARVVCYQLAIEYPFSYFPHYRSQHISLFLSQYRTPTGFFSVFLRLDLQYGWKPVI